MKKTLVAIVTSCAVTAAFAQASAPSAPATAAGVQTAASAPAGSKRETRVEERIAKLHADLRITSAQEAQWAPFADAMRDNARAMADLYRQRIAQRDTMSALDDMKQYQQITQANADGTKRLVDAFEPLYTSLSPEQKKLADTSFRQEGRDHARRDHAHRQPRASGADAASATKP
ncbi:MULTISPECIES: Spy/CpxP family protein refolding chaperone [unclassified Caballeronia]|uniref:Spy/CpxP family protein refolding chaperone n=1 Tax=unclassified Caballeronia TaxID=2646786 RepID=UPI00285CBF1A|nr:MULTISPECIES: Spy/CpxP family protein refolding chaperone [unclassified Caballeronia]MDR5738307.1 Spy/CpxP family protein refolding chaperone [Caballeronia sp. LZ016]MDR5811837.1 Spy/CpxP family protein refolding chaperone [Caballeronia sp. LZ019]